ncbi:MAG: DUF3617 domain-containing protein [Sphingomicrobium sp.]
MMRLATFALLATASLALSACNKGPSVDLKNVTPAEVAKAMKDSGANRDLVRPGKWASTVSIVAIDTTQLPPKIAAKINAELGKPRTVEACLTDQQVDHPERMLAQVPGGCRYEYYKMSGGKIDGHMVCTGPAGKQETNVTGTYGKDQYAMTVENKANAAPGAPTIGNASSTMKIESHRLGDCDAKPAG